MLQETLKQATQQNHNELEQLMYVHEIMSGTLSVQQYKEILTTNYIVHKTFEDELYSAVSPQLVQQLNLDKRRKLDALIADMQEMQIALPSIESPENIRFGKTDAEILGALYVLEGATLGGSVIVKRLKTNSNFVALNPGFHYYQVYGAELIPYWKSFCEILNQQSQETFELSTAGAKKMFEYIAEVSAGVKA